MKCYSMKIKEWNDDIIFLHEVVEGVAHRSYGTHVAKLAGLPENVIQRAKIVLKELEESEKSSAIDSLAEDLPLFKNAVPEQSAEKEMDNKLKDYLLEIKPDSLTPRDALEIVYELKGFNRRLNIFNVYQLQHSKELNPKFYQKHASPFQYTARIFLRSLERVYLHLQEYLVALTIRRYSSPSFETRWMGCFLVSSRRTQEVA